MVFCTRVETRTLDASFQVQNVCFQNLKVFGIPIRKPGLKCPFIQGCPNISLAWEDYINGKCCLDSDYITGLLKMEVCHSHLLPDPMGLWFAGSDSW